MFGFLTADTATLTPEELTRYRSCYCGLCRALKDRFGQLTRMVLTYDMTFLVLLLESLYEPEGCSGEAVCPVHPTKAQAWCRSELTDYAADMNAALAYLKCLDDWQDDGNAVALAEAGVLKKGYREVCARYPRQCGAMEHCIARLGELERENAPADETAEVFGELMGELFVLYDDRWSETLRHMGRALGRFIYALDACVDLDGDTRRNRYNPFRRYYGAWDTAERFGDILKLFLGEALFYYDKLPLVQDTGILKNILCTGVWVQFNKKYRLS